VCVCPNRGDIVEPICRGLLQCMLNDLGNEMYLKRNGVCRWKPRVRKKCCFRPSFFILSDYVINKFMNV
jgi:hypothetical protein